MYARQDAGFLHFCSKYALFVYFNIYQLIDSVYFIIKALKAGLGGIH